MRWLFAFNILTSMSIMGEDESSPPRYVIGSLLGQAGNNFFQIATASALAWDHDGVAFFPQLGSVPTLYHHYFSRCKMLPPIDSPTITWQEPHIHYKPIPFTSGMTLQGYFQSWKYFDHHRERLLSLFAPTKKDLKRIFTRYQHILDHSCSVGIQVRYYAEEAPSFIQYDRAYFQKAMDYFPPDALFIVSSNNLTYAKAQIPTQGYQVFFFEQEQPHIEFYTLTLCKHNIISNSTFGWWSAYLNQNPHKIVLCPTPWAKDNQPDIYPKNWIQISLCDHATE